MSTAAESLYRGLAAGWRPDRIISVSEWADEHRILVSATTRQYGHWRTPKTPYARAIMDALSPHSGYEDVVLMKGSQIAGTEMGNNWIGHTIHISPGPMMVVFPRVEDAKDNSKDRIMPMIRACPVLAERVRENRSRDSENTILEKKFRGGMLKITGANSAAGLRNRPIQRILFEEIDAYPDDVDGEGDPIALAKMRTATYGRTRKFFYNSSPTLKGLSKIEKLYLQTDQRRYFIPCPFCGHMDYLTWRDIGHHRIEFDGHDHKTAHMVCSGCNASIAEHFKPQMLAAGVWTPTAPENLNPKRIGFHLSGLYSPLGFTWADVAEKFLLAKRDRAELKVWVNTCLGESWEERSESIEPHALMARRETYLAEVPNGVGILVASVDVQADRLEWKVKGFGAEEESWLIAAASVPGDPALDKPWLELDEILRQEWNHESGQKLKIEAVAVDTNFLSDHCYAFCRARLDRRVFAIRGGQTSGQPLVTKPSRSNAYRIPLYTLCVDTGKETVYSRLQVSTPGSGCMHFPDFGWADLEYFEQLTAERAYSKWIRGRGTVRVWKKTRDRNEALDLEVYALAALHILWPDAVRARNLASRAAKLAVKVDPQAPPAPPEDGGSPAPRRPIAPRRPGGWVKGWRR